MENIYLIHNPKGVKDDVQKKKNNNNHKGIKKVPHFQKLYLFTNAFWILTFVFR